MKHIHKYIKTKLGKNKDWLVYRCILPNCSHYIRPELLPGKMAICFRCEDKFIVTSEMVRKGKEMLKLHCIDCTKSRKGKKREIKKVAEVKAASILSAFGIESPSE